MGQKTILVPFCYLKKTVHIHFIYVAKTQNDIVSVGKNYLYKWVNKQQIMEFKKTNDGDSSPEETVVRWSGSRYF